MKFNIKYIEDIANILSRAVAIVQNNIAFRIVLKSGRSYLAITIMSYMQHIPSLQVEGWIKFHHH